MIHGLGTTFIGCGNVWFVLLASLLVVVVEEDVALAFVLVVPVELLLVFIALGGDMAETLVFTTDDGDEETVDVAAGVCVPVAVFVPLAGILFK